MTFKEFPIYRSHLDLARAYWEKFLSKGSKVIDATCGNGKDSLYLAGLTLSEDSGHLFCIDIQKQAIENSKKLLKDNLLKSQFERVSFHHHSFEIFPSESFECDLIVYNLGYLPGGDKSIVTNRTTSLKSLELSLKWVKDGGMISLSCYTGHEEGLIETNFILKYLESLEPSNYTVCSYNFINRNKAPLLILIQKAFPKTALST
jgi:tRNA G37 N-methylase Trm5